MKNQTAHLLFIERAPCAISQSILIILKIK